MVSLRPCFTKTTAGGLKERSVDKVLATQHEDVFASPAHHVKSHVWWHMPVTPALWAGREDRQTDAGGLLANQLNGNVGAPGSGRDYCVCPVPPQQVPCPEQPADQALPLSLCPPPGLPLAKTLCSKDFL